MQSAVKLATLADNFTWVNVHKHFGLITYKSAGGKNLFAGIKVHRHMLTIIFTCHYVIQNHIISDGIIRLHILN
jgi:hypothetical protein